MWRRAKIKRQVGVSGQVPEAITVTIVYTDRPSFMCECVQINVCVINK